jgi:hypothetical protein
MDAIGNHGDIMTMMVNWDMETPTMKCNPNELKHLMERN